MSTSLASGSRSVFFSILALIIVVAAAVRIVGLFNDFWLDEIWSWEIARHMPSPQAIFTQVHHDNNHWLNTLIMYALGRQHWIIYRLFSLLTSIGAVIAAVRIGSRYGRWEAILAGFLIGFSYILVYYSSEARGYGPAVFFALVSFALLQQQIASFAWWRAGLFAAAAALAFLSHLSFIYVYAGMLVWSALAFFRSRRSWPDAVLVFTAHHALPLALIFIVYIVDIRHWKLGGGDTPNIGDVLRQTVVLSLGVPDRSSIALAVALAVGMAFIYELRTAPRRDSSAWFFCIAVVLAPAALLIARPPEVLYPRYFLLAIPFLLLVLARFLARCARHGLLPGLVVTAILLGFCLGNARQIREFFRYGRGNYRAAIAYMVSHTRAPIVTVGSDNDFRNRLILDYYVSSDPPAKPVAYLPHGSWTEKTPLWYILHHYQRQPPPGAIEGSNGVRYLLQQGFLYSGPSGWSWFVYRSEFGG